ncbi:MAG: glycogen synthase GlgA [Candidatus Sedimenticola endophacoides]
MKILFASSEAQPLIKTGGLADVAGSLPPALSHLGEEVRLVLPAYPTALEQARELTPVSSLRIGAYPGEITIHQGTLEEGVTLYLVEIPGMFDRPGNPYVDGQGNNWPDNAQRFAAFCRVVANIALGQAGLKWLPEIVHCNDWQTGLVPALITGEGNRPASIFTIHNMAYQGVFDRITFDQLQLPPALWSMEGLEFHNNFSFLKGGLAFADWITTVSPTYAGEILTPAFGYGLDGLLEYRKSRLTGVLNGIDYRVWDPAGDPAIAQPYDAQTLKLKAINKQHLQQELGLPRQPEALLIGNIGRLVEQKGVDLILDILPGLMHKENLQVAILGSGDPELERRLTAMADAHPGKIAVHIGYDEALAHRIEAGCDCFLMPSRFEPCGLNQLYSLRYGTVPIVNRTGGLADTVVDATPRNLLEGTATGFVFDRPQPPALCDCLERVIEFWNRPAMWWEKLVLAGMRQDFSWDSSAHHYRDIYHRAIDNPAPSPVARKDD